MLPTPEQESLWQSMARFMPYNSSSVQHLRISDIAECPEEDEQGKKKIDGFKISWEGVVPADWDNGNGTMHGAAAAWVVDVCTSAAIMIHTTDRFWGPPLIAGVSLAIDMIYLHPARVGSDIVVEVEVLKCSSTTANLKCDIRNRQSRQLLSSGTHLKAWRSKSRTAKL